MKQLIKCTKSEVLAIRRNLFKQSLYCATVGCRQYLIRSVPDEIQAEDVNRLDIDEFQVKMKEILQRTPMFLESNYKISHFSGKKGANIEYNDPTSIKQILENGVLKVPIPGSVVEFDFGGESCSLGIVLEGCSTKFNENYNKLTVLTLHNELVQVYTQDVTIHFHGILDRKTLSGMSQDILNNKRHDTSGASRLQLVTFIEQFVRKSIEIQERLKLESQFDTVYAHFSQMHQVTPVSLLDVVHSIKLDETVALDINDSLFEQCTLIMACHIELSSDPMKWVVPTLYRANRFTNVARKDGSSNNLVSQMTYLSNSVVNHDSVKTLLQLQHIEKQSPSASEFLSQLLETQSDQLTRKLFMDLTLYFSFWEGAKFKWLINVMKLSVVYPHPKIRTALAEVLNWKVTDLTPANIYKTLRQANVYVDDSSDILFSANMLGEPKINQISVKSPQEIVPTNISKILERSLDYISDNFTHLRDNSRFYKDLTIYGLPSTQESTIGISLEKSNVRKYWLNIHLQDPTTRIAPSSQLFQMLASSGIRSSLQRLLRTDSLEIFSKEFLDLFLFKTQNVVRKSDFVSVADEVPSDSQEVSFPNLDQLKTCMTISFAYYPYANDPFHSLAEKVRVSFDDISKLEVKCIPSFESLENILLGKTESGEGRGKFSLFKRRLLLSQLLQATLLDEKDGHDIRFIHNIMKTYSKVRNLRGASLADPSLENMIDSNPESFQELGGFLCREIGLLSQDLAAHYCWRNNIPVFTSRQNNLVTDTAEEVETTDLENMFQNKSDKIGESDQVFLSHNNLLLPEYFAETYFQTLLCRDSMGNMPSPAKISGQNFLNKKQLEVMVLETGLEVEEEEEYIDPLIQEGFLLGSVDVSNLTSSFLSLMNQYQILAHVHSLAKSRFSEKLTYMQMIEQFSYLKRLGYPTEGPLPWEALDDEIVKLDKESAFQNYLTAAHKKFKKLQELENILVNGEGEVANKIDFTCVVTKIDKQIDDRLLASAFCLQLGIEIEVLLNGKRSVTVGSFIECDRLIFLDTIGGRLVLEATEMI